LPAPAAALLNREMERFRDRAEAGRLLAERLREYAGRDDVVVLGLPRGGVPVAFEVARALGAPLDVFVVRKLGVPDNPELAFGAIASGGIRVIDRDRVQRLGIAPEQIQEVVDAEREELERRERIYRGERSPIDVGGQTVILVDDGLATGASMIAAVHAVRQERPARIAVAVPVAHPSVCRDLASVADEAICIETPDTFRSVGEWYEDFSQTGDDDVRELIELAYHPEDADPPLRITPLEGDASGYDELIERMAGRRLALIGEASHGTHEFYRERAELTKRLIADHGFTFVAIEGDWPDAYRVNRYVRGEGDDSSPEEALGDFERFPRWMWRNTVVEEFVGWLRDWNDGLGDGGPKVGFYGLDLYSLFRSMDAVVEYLEDIDPAAAERARARYSCFDHFGRDPQLYGYGTGLGDIESCEQQAVQQLVEIRDMEAAGASSDGQIDDDGHFYAEQNARLAAAAEEYYRQAFRSGVRSWNLRDTHMVETLDALMEHLGRRQSDPRAVVWAHNSHLGDARATEMGQRGEVNVGQLVRERHGDDAFLLGFTTYTGTVTAASDWGAPSERKRVLRGTAGSWERRLHETEVPRFVLDPSTLERRRLERAIGVIYRPETERFSHYFQARIGNQFDAVIHIDQTNALEPLVPAGEWVTELPDTYPWGV
jgi:erythromycin esterase-like protein/predicted phosphoribosyltransferase